MTLPATAVDRVARATDHLSAAYGIGSASAATVELAAAQVEATLALVEQQRIANLIALERLHLGRPDTDGMRRSVGVPNTVTLNEIDAGLDLEGIAERRSR